MTRLLPVAFLLLLAAAAQAQQADSLAALAPDSLSATRLRAGSLPAFITIQPALSRVAGVQVTPYSGAPGAWATVRIRGIAHVTGSSQPLYVVDGVPAYNTEVTPEESPRAGASFNNNSYLVVPTPSTPAANPLLDLPVEDVAQVEVLKGAAATARYGMQGANGVVLITTRRGADGSTAPQPLRVRYAGWVGVQQVRQRYDLLNARQYADLANVAAAESNRPPRYSATDLAGLSEGSWQDRVLRVAGVQSHNLSVDGLAHHTRYYLAADYLNQAGVVRQSGLERYHLRANLDQQLTAKLSVGLNASVSQTDQHYAGTEFDAGPLLREALRAAPAVQAGAPAANPLLNLTYFASSPRTRRLLAQLGATYRFSNALILSVRGSREQADARRLDYSPENFDFGIPSKQVVETGTVTTSQYNWVVDAALRYGHTFGGQHALAAGLTYLHQKYGRAFDHHEYRGAGLYRFESNYQFSRKNNGIHSPAASLGYTYAGRYEVQASLRTDFAFSSDGTKSEYHWFPGAQLSWHLHKEAFLATASGLSELTLWGGVGQTSTFFSPDRTTHQDAGLRLGLLGGRLTLEASAYQRRTSNAQTRLLIEVPTGTGYISYYLFPDVALLNQGLELTLGSTWRLGALAGVTQLAAAANRNRVEEIGGNSQSGLRVQQLEVGQPVSRFFVYEQQGTYPAGSPNAGQVRLRDRNGDGQINYADGSYQGSGLPRHTLSLYQQFRLRRFGLTAQLDGLFGYQILNPTLVALDAPTGGFNSTTRALDYWTLSHQDTAVPRAVAYPSFLLSDQTLESGDHVRLSQLTLSYDVLPMGPRRASVWVGGQNLFVTGNYRGFDPNVSSGGASPLLAGQDASVYPVARVWQVGVRGQF